MYLDKNKHDTKYDFRNHGHFLNAGAEYSLQAWKNKECLRRLVCNNIGFPCARICFFSLCFMVLSSRAQDFCATSTMQITDPSGAVIQNAAITATNVRIWNDLYREDF